MQSKLKAKGLSVWFKGRVPEFNLQYCKTKERKEKKYPEFLIEIQYSNGI
jgi:hypothetical protein